MEWSEKCKSARCGVSSVGCKVWGVERKVWCVKC